MLCIRSTACSLGHLVIITPSRQTSANKYRLIGAGILIFPLCLLYKLESAGLPDRDFNPRFSLCKKLIENKSKAFFKKQRQNVCAESVKALYCRIYIVTVDGLYNVKNILRLEMRPILLYAVTLLY